MPEVLANKSGQQCPNQCRRGTDHNVSPGSFPINKPPIAVSNEPRGKSKHFGEEGRCNGLLRGVQLEVKKRKEEEEYGAEEGRPTDATDLCAQRHQCRDRQHKGELVVHRHG